MQNIINTQTEVGVTLVLGGTGKTGRRIVSQLKDKGLEVRVGSRSGDPKFLWEDQSTWGPVLENVKSVYIAFYPDLAVPGATDAIKAFSELAVKSGVTHLVLLSGRGEEEAQRCEEIVKNSGADWTIVRTSWFAQNFSEAFMRDMVLEGTLALPVGGVKEPFIDADDIADVAVAALTEEGHKGELYELTGPRLMTFSEAVEQISAATGLKVQFIDIPNEAFMSAMKAQGVPEDYVWLVNYLFTEVLDGRNEYVCDGVERALGRKARDFSEYAMNAAAQGAWNIEEVANG
ncbi:MAG: NAD(P)H-binding protein [Thermodesulfobacteriota bacterium]